MGPGHRKRAGPAGAAQAMALKEAAQAPVKEPEPDLSELQAGRSPAEEALGKAQPAARPPDALSALRVVEGSLDRRDFEPSRGSEQPDPEIVPEGVDEEHKSLLRRHPRASVLAFILAMAALGFGYLYWDNARRFESTDDAFIAARQFSVAPKVSGYLTAVPVTD